jgi:hypothetical protein
MKKRLLTAALLVGMLFTVAAVDPECDNSDAVTTARSGVSIASAKHRLEMENTPGAIQHLYILSAYSGQVLLYSTVKGKVTSSGKRLSPTQRAVTGYSADYHPELIGDDGTYGTSIEYLYWWDVKGVYRQIYVTGGTFTVISDQPQQFGHVTMQAEIRK